VPSSRVQSIEIPQRLNCSRNASIDFSVASRGFSPVSIALFSAGSPKASYPIGWTTL
jgi:hypothetical protein